MKLGHGLARQEFEEETTREVFEALWSITKGRRLRKRRYFVPAEGRTWEIDEFLDRDLFLAEIEIPSIDFAVAMPEWLEPYVVSDVTLERAYANFALAR
jgi:adenylate cyclase